MGLEIDRHGRSLSPCCCMVGAYFVTSVGFSFGDPLAGFWRLYALFRRRFALASLRSAPQAILSICPYASTVMKAWRAAGLALACARNCSFLASSQP